MKDLRLKDFVEFSGINAKLINTVKKQSGLNWVEFQDYLENVSNSPCGAAGGFSGFVWYSETSSFWRKNRKLITELMQEQADSLGENLLSMVLGFDSLKDGSFSQEEIGRALFGNFNEDYIQIYNTFAWFALEEIAYRFSDFKYENE
ncbi:hypothetical protein C7120_08955 [Prevotella sp. oral taxon 376]|uniref:DUF7222 domain-containing protein n=1 Tax=Prevotella sp. oral taxon 376 TaxID=712466 RepID=UPI000D1F20BB|nr:hypothetical protein [Prevotella sp. oral taxon 376]PTL34618.1 hypothetical protein C7120_08955 [Prevotella sp. oral taxon 376]